MAEETKEVLPQKRKWWKKLLLMMIKSPVNTIFVFGGAYFVSQAYLFEPTITNKIALFAILGLWVFWFLAKQAFMILIALGLLIGGASVYYAYTHKEARACEEAGGYWNSNTQVCEEKRSFWDKVKAFFIKTEQAPAQKLKVTVAPDGTPKAQVIVEHKIEDFDKASEIDELTGEEIAVIDNAIENEKEGEKE